MSGIYFHIPFCKVKCSYCDFYKTTNNSKLNELVQALQLEIWLQQNYLEDKTIHTIYFGGGTPSLLSAEELDALIVTCKKVFHVAADAEITMEANPDDLNLNYLKAVKNIGINRLSIGVQSFSQSDLKLMKRRHNPLQAANAVKYAKEAGFDNISVDLIYGVPYMSFEQWKSNLAMVFEMDIQHVSAYHLTYHKNTQLWHDLQKGKIQEIEEKDSIQQFEALVNVAKSKGFEHYEISNFCKQERYSKHNSSYWNQTDYLGLGPSAHSYDKKSRQWNVASLTHYLLALDHKKVPFEREILSIKDRFNDYMITALRTRWGIDLNYVQTEFGEKYLTHVMAMGQKYVKTQQITLVENSIKMAPKGWFVSDSIMSDFML